MKLENVFMLLPNRTVGFGSIEIEGDTTPRLTCALRQTRRTNRASFFLGS